MKEITYFVNGMAIMREMENEEADDHLARIGNKQMRCVHFQIEDEEYVIPVDKIDAVLTHNVRQDEH